MDFYSDLKKLIYAKPKNAIHSRASENATFGDYVFRSKNIYLSYFLNDCHDCYYSEYLANCRDCNDCMHVSASELCYECTDCTGLYSCTFLQDCHNCSNVNFSIDCLNCKDCFGCFGLRHRQFCIFNKQYSEATYKEKVQSLIKSPPAKVHEILSPEFLKHPRLYSRLLKGDENCYGDYIYYSKNCFQCFDVRNLEDSAYMNDIMSPEYNSGGSFDCTLGSGLNGCYECLNSNLCTNCNFLEDCVSCADSEYLVNCFNCSNCFGCVNLTNKEYCILNRQLTREEYLVALPKIKEELKKSSAYGKPLAVVIK